MSLKDDLYNLGVKIEARLETITDSGSFATASGGVDAARLACESAMMKATDWMPLIQDLLIVVIVKATGASVDPANAPLNTVLQFKAIPPVAVSRIDFSPVAGSLQDVNKSPGPYTQAFTLTAPGQQATGHGQGFDPVTGKVICEGSLTVTAKSAPVVTPAPLPQPTPAPTGANIPDTAADVAVFDRSKLRKLTADYTLKAGETLSGVDTNGHSIKAVLKAGEKAVVKDSLITAGYVSQSKLGDRYGVDCNGNLGSVTVDNCEITRSSGAGIYGDNFLCRRSWIHANAADASKPQHNATLEECYIEDVGMDNPASHADGGQTESGSDVTYRRCNIHLVAGTRNGHTFKASQGIIFAARPGETSKRLMVDGCRIYCTNTGILAYTDSGDGSSITIQNCDITAAIPLNTETGAKLINNKLTKL